MDADEQFVDLSFLYEISDNDEVYIYDVLKLFLESSQTGVSELVKASETDDYQLIAKKAHFLKSSANIVKIKDMHTLLVQIEQKAKENIGLENADKSEIQSWLNTMVGNFNAALPFIIAEKDRMATTIK